MGDAFVFDVKDNGEIVTLATFKDRVGTTYNFTVEAYDNYEREDPVYFNDSVVLKVTSVCMVSTSDQCVHGVHK